MFIVYIAEIAMFFAACAAPWYAVAKAFAWVDAS